MQQERGECPILHWRYWDPAQGRGRGKRGYASQDALELCVFVSRLQGRMTLCTDSSRKVWWGRDTQSSRYLEYNRVEKVTWHVLRLTAFHAEPHQNEHLEKGDRTRREAVGKVTHVGQVGLAQGCERCRFSTNGKKSMRFFKDSTTRLGGRSKSPIIMAKVAAGSIRI